MKSSYDQLDATIWETQFLHDDDAIDELFAISETAGPDRIAALYVIEYISENHRMMLQDVRGWFRFIRNNYHVNIPRRQLIDLYIRTYGDPRGSDKRFPMLHELTGVLMGDMSESRPSIHEELGIDDPEGPFCQCVQIYIYVVAVTEELFRVRDSMEPAARFTRIAAQLPIELQMRVCLSIVLTGARGYVGVSPTVNRRGFILSRDVDAMLPLIDWFD